MSEFTHLDGSGAVRMVDVTAQAANGPPSYCRGLR